MRTGKRGFNLLITLSLVATWMGCSSDKQLTGPAGSAQVSLNIQFAQSVAKQNFGHNIDNAIQIIQEVTVSVLEAGSNAVVIKEQQLEINSTPEGRFAEGELSIPVRDESQPFNIVVFAGDPDNLLFFAGTANVTLESGETREQPVDIFLQLATSIASSGTANASSTFPLQGFEAGSAIDLNFGTSWFSAGPSVDGNTSTFTWTAPKEEFLGTIGIFNNESHFNSTYRTEFGFRTVTFQVYDGPNASGTMLYEETVDYPKAFPVVRVSPFVSGQSIRLLLNDHQDISCGGFSELLVVALDLSTGEPVKTLLTIDLSPLNPTIDVGQTQPFTATGTFSDNSTSDITNQVTWASNDQNVATINSAGLSTAIAAGTAIITATQGNISGQSTLSVNSLQLSGATLSNLQAPLAQLNDSTNCDLFGGPVGSRFALSFDYTDLDGDVTTGTVVNVSFTFSPSGGIGSFTVSSPALTGGGAQGSISFGACFVFSSETSVRVDINITDTGGRVSSSISFDIQKPEGANSPPPGKANEQRNPIIPKIAEPNKP